VLSYEDFTDSASISGRKCRYAASFALFCNTMRRFCNTFQGRFATPSAVLRQSVSPEMRNFAPES